MTVTAVRTALSPAHARPSRPKVCVQTAHWYAFLRMLLGSIGSVSSRRAMTLPWHGGPGRVHRGLPPAASVAGSELGAWHGGQDLLLVVDRAAAVGGDAGGVVGGHHQRIDIAARDGQPEVVADEGDGARVVMAGAGHLVDAVDGLAGLLGIPGELRDPCVATDRHGPLAGPAVLVGLQGGVDAEVAPAHMLGQHAGVIRAGGTAVIERHRHRPVRAGRDRGLNWSLAAGSA